MLKPDNKIKSTSIAWLFFLVAFFLCDSLVNQSYSEDHLASKVDEDKLIKETLNAFLADFDHTKLNRVEIANMQFALLTRGLYEERVDGIWNKKTEIAFRNYARKEKKKLQIMTVYALMEDHNDDLNKDDWAQLSLKDFKMRVYYPRSFFVEENSDRRSHLFRHRYTNMVFDVWYLKNIYELRGHHKAAVLDKKKYRWKTIKSKNKWVTKSENDAGHISLVISIKRGKQWHTMNVFGHRRDYKIINSIFYSATIGPDSLIGEPGNGFLMQLKEKHRAGLDLLLARKKERKEKAIRIAQEINSGILTNATAKSSGTGFYINKDGYLITNAHVVNKCKIMGVKRKAHKVIALSAKMDLAVLKPLKPSQSLVIAKFSPKPAKLNASVTVAGYPYADILGGLNITRGSVSARRGIGDDISVMQITAPIQPGNSGGPVVGNYGNIVGVSVSSLDSTMVAKQTQSLPQNVNFAIKSEIVKSFLNAHDIQYSEGVRFIRQTPENLAHKLSQLTVRVNCY